MHLPTLRSILIPIRSMQPCLPYEIHYRAVSSSPTKWVLGKRSKRVAARPAVGRAKRRLLVIAPANLRKQWTQELADKFYLPAAILETKTFNASLKAGNLNPFEQGAVVICSYQFARTEGCLRQSDWLGSGRHR